MGHSRTHWRVGLAHTGAGLALGVALVTFYWLPAIVELPNVRFDTMRSVGNSYEANFSQFAELFDYPPLPIDTANLNPPVRRPLALLPLAIVLSGPVMLVIKALSSKPASFSLIALRIPDIPAPTMMKRRSVRGAVVMFSPVVRVLQCPAVRGSAREARPS